jgi:hypothetical protein
VRLAGGEKRGVRSAVAERHAKALRVADHHVGAHLARRREQRQGQQVGGHGDQHAGGMGAGNDLRQILDAAVLVGILQQHPEDVVA